jgi:hypothetical protein
MNRIVSVAVVLLVAVSVSAKDRFTREPEQVFIATTGHIIKIDAEARTMRVRGSEGPAVRNLLSAGEHSRQRFGVKMPGILLPGCIKIGLPGRTGKVPRSKSTFGIPNLDEYTVLTTSDTVFQDGGDSIRFEDFKNGETISIHGVLRGATLTASRVAKWD